MRSSRRLPGALVTLAAFAATAFLCGACATSPRPPEEIVARRNQAAQYAEMANAYFRQARYDDAIDFFELALAENRMIDNEAGIVSAYNSLGAVYLATGDPATAEQYFGTAYERASSLGPSRELVESANSLGELMLREDRLEQALEYLVEAVDLSSDLGDASQRAIVLHNLAAVYSRLGRLDEAEERFREALSLNLDEKRYEEAASNHYMLASVYAKREDYSSALENAKEALRLDKKMESSIGIAKDLKALGLISRRLGDDEAAYHYFTRSLQVFLGLAMSGEVAAVLDQLTEVSETTGRTDEAESYAAERSKLP